MRQLSLLSADELEGLLVIRVRRRPSRLEDAAHRYAAAVVAHQGSNGRTALEALLERESAEHELIVLAGFVCPYCSAGDCPVRPIRDTAPL